jgi:hypothetical protein
MATASALPTSHTMITTRRGSRSASGPAGSENSANGATPSAPTTLAWNGVAS